MPSQIQRRAGMPSRVREELGWRVGSSFGLAGLGARRRFGDLGDEKIGNALTGAEEFDELEC